MIQKSTLFKYFKREPRSELPSKLQANERLTMRDIESANKKVKSEIDRNETDYLFHRLSISMRRIIVRIRPLQIDFLFPVHRPHGLFVKPENSIISVH